VSAVYSPSECPAAATGAFPITSRNDSHRAYETAKRAGCACSVRVSSSPGPSRHIERSDQPRIESEVSPRSSGWASKRSAPMPTAWLPWPGKRIA
jgi:hypothetical protein